MIAKITRGDDLNGLVTYLAGPGRSNEHTAPQVVAAADGIVIPHGVELSAAERLALVDQLEAPAKMFGTEVQGGRVWHLSLTIPNGDGELTNEQWAEAAQEVADEMGFTADDGQGQANWVAMRHGVSKAGNDHVHMAVSLIREDGTKASNWQERVKVNRVAARLEKRFGLTVVEGRTAGAVPGATRAEIEQAERGDQPETDRARLGRTVRGAALASKDEAEFVRRLRDRGVAVRPRFASGGQERVTGYSVAIAGRDKPTWFGGGKLAKDLRLPALRAGWNDVENQRGAWTSPSTGAGGREQVAMSADVWQQTAPRVRQLTDRLAQISPDDHEGWAVAARAASGMYAELSARIEGDTPGPLGRAADTLARSAQKADHSGRPPDLAGLAAVAGQAAFKGKGGAAAWVILAGELLRLSKALSELHAARAEQQRATDLLAQARAAQPTPSVQSGPEQQLIRPTQRGTDFGR